MVVCDACKAKKPEHRVRYVIDDTVGELRHYACNTGCLALLATRFRAATGRLAPAKLAAYTGATPSLPDALSPYNAEVYGSKDIGGKRIG